MTSFLRCAAVALLLAAACASAAASDAPTSVPPSYGFDCAILGKLPYGGTEILYASSIFLILTMLWGVTYADICIKQWFPAQWMDPNVLTIMAEVRAALPNLNLSAEEKKQLYTEETAKTSHYAIAMDGTQVQYDAIAAQEAYIASKTIDLDIMYQMLNNNTFSTMSEYSADTVRGYSMLATMLSSAGFCLTFLAIHNFYVDPRAIQPGLFGIKFGVIAVFFYPFIICTSIVMTGPSGIVHRHSNICLMSNLPPQVNGGKNPVRDLHVLGVVLFAMPIIEHLIALLSWGPSTMPNYAADLTLMLLALFGLAVFGISYILQKIDPSISNITKNNVSITGEWFMMIACFLSCVHWEGFATMYCSGNLANFQNMLYIAFLAPFVLVLRSQIWAPTTYVTTPSLLLLYQGQITGAWGPIPVVAYHGQEVVTAQRRVTAGSAPALPHCV